jgi:plasmid stabilization system protein ParE
MRIRWTPAAAADLQNISDYLKEHHPRYRVGGDLGKLWFLFGGEIYFHTLRGTLESAFRQRR